MQYGDFTALKRTRRTNVLAIVDNPKGVTPKPDNVFEVRDPTRKDTFVEIYWRRDHWRCLGCGGKADPLRKPCLHLWALWIHLGIVARNKAQPHFPDKVVDQAAYDLSRRRKDEIEPLLIHDLLATMPDTEAAESGPEPIPERELMAGAFVYVWGKAGMREAEGILKDWHRRGLISQPYAYSAISEYMGRPETLQKVMRLITISAVTAKGFTFSGGSDGTGLQRHNWGPWRVDAATKHRIQEQRRLWRAYHKAVKKWRKEVDRCKRLGLVLPSEPERPKKLEELDAEAGVKAMEKHRLEVERCLVTGQAPPSAPVFAEKPLARGYLTAIPWYFFETNLVGALVIRPRSPIEYEDDEEDDADEDDGFWNAETPYFLGMLDLLRPLFPRLKQVRADKALYKFTHYLFGKVWGIDMQIPFSRAFKPGAGDGKSGAGRKAASEQFARFKDDPAKHYRDYHKRSQQEGCQNGVKVAVGAHIHTRCEVQQVVEGALKFLVWNIRQLNYHHFARDGWWPDFNAAAVDVDAEPWVSVEQRSLKYRGKDAESIIQREAWEAKRRADEAEGAAPG